MKLRSKARSGALIAMAVVVACLSACMYYASQPDGLVPTPDSAEVKRPPEILSCSATFAQTIRTPYYETVCDWVWIPYPCWLGGDVWSDCGWWGWECWSVWRYTEVCGDILLKLEVYDPSDDLVPSKSPALVVHPGEALSGAACRLSTPEKQIAIQPQHIAPGLGQPKTKTISVQYTNVCGRITSTCKELGVSIPLSIAFQDCGTVLLSRNTCYAEVRVK